MDKHCNLLPDNTNVKKINLALPLASFSTTSENYGLILTDADGVTHYFNEDGTYDGWSRELNLNEN